jgi:hypothetical protein
MHSRGEPFVTFVTFVVQKTSDLSARHSVDRGLTGVAV